MPSMHVAVATLIALAAGSYRRWLGLALAPVVPVIWIGSIHLGWHYAVDGQLAVPLVLGIWAVSGWVVTRIGISDVEAHDATTPEPATVFPLEADG